MKKRKIKIKSFGLLITVIILVATLGIFLQAGATEVAQGADDLTVTIDTGADVTIRDTDKDGSYEIATADELYAFAEAVNNGEPALNAELTSNIIVNSSVPSTDDVADGNSYRKWIPIGNGNPYEGRFDGNGKAIFGLYFRDTTDGDVGLIGELGAEGEVKNVLIYGSYFHGSSCIGAVVGVSYGTVSGCSSMSTVQGHNNYLGWGVGGGADEDSPYDEKIYGEYGASIGGVVGENYGIVSDCYSRGTVKNNYYVGGVVGWNGGTVTNCFSEGYVEGTDYVGGVVGQNDYGTVSNCYNTGIVIGVSGSGNVGGVVGYVNNGGRLTDSYNIGNVTGSATYYSVVKYVEDGCTVENCYYIAESESKNDGVDGTHAKTAAQFESGEVAALLGSAFGQTLKEEGRQDHPVLGGTRVYNNIVSGCAPENYVYEYSNTEAEPVISHNAEEYTYSLEPSSDSHTIIYNCCDSDSKEEPHTYDSETHRCVCGKLEDGYHTVYVAEDIERAYEHVNEIKVDSLIVKAGEAVIFEVGVKEGFRIRKAIVVCDDGTEIVCTVMEKNYNSSYAKMSFVMPDQNVKFKKFEVVAQAEGPVIELDKYGEGSVEISKESISLNPSTPLTFTVTPDDPTVVPHVTVTSDVPLLNTTELFKVAYETTQEDGKYIYTVRISEYAIEHCDMKIEVVLCYHNGDKFCEENGDAHNVLCSECNYVLGVESHSFGEEHMSGEDGHWNECACGAVANRAAHADTDGDEKCDTCEYEMPVPPVPPTTPDSGETNDGEVGDSSADSGESDSGNTENTVENNAVGNPDEGNTDDGDRLGIGATVAIVVGSVAVLGLGGFALFRFVIKKKKKSDMIEK